MKEQILENICSLYRSHIVTAIMFLVLIALAIMVTVGVIKFDLVKSPKGRLALIATVVLCTVFLIISQVVAIVPVYKDYQNSSYIIVEDATMVVKGNSSGVLDRTSTVCVKTPNGEYELNIRTDLKLDIDTEYVGTVVFLKYSKYIIWYEFN